MMFDLIPVRRDILMLSTTTALEDFVGEKI
jgi:hypothetical protein